MLCLSCNQEMFDNYDDFYICMPCEIIMYTVGFKKDQCWSFSYNDEEIYSREKFIKFLKLKAFT